MEFPWPSVPIKRRYEAKFKFARHFIFSRLLCSLLYLFSAHYNPLGNICAFASLSGYKPGMGPLNLLARLYFVEALQVRPSRPYQ